MEEITGITITEEIEEYRRKIALLGIRRYCINYVTQIQFLHAHDKKSVKDYLIK